MQAALEAEVTEHLQRLWTEWHRSVLAADTPPHAAVLTAGAAGVLAGPPAAVRDGELRGMQLQLAVRSLRRSVISQPHYDQSWCTDVVKIC